ncbi:UDP-N-acetylmuramoyl-L-alanyl-D-glutamate--2,6-diaminopimelate ligase [Rhodococcus triatomae]|uniref:UDP-N-acetylmuramoyl-L-alanyl-D-glutamate--2,6-diaminopimelate ligase n=1 Tax=Rhodococcus triatomae TaxID=300028 RepID=A0A1G8D1X7_9NOCA|nr:UDP-N-acetylmuramoyl-L-alanyl-D-glutamate--2,6-diaminopimelate ligase [Rhodococcus triatomae]SDH51837.1 UDP-N-acetylmuramoyl-L-alanyl-D-glutamate--2,6-diaminopimelate ligase [Rhodococcus triatomae]
MPSSSQPSSTGTPASGLRPENVVRTRLTDLARLVAGRIEFAGPAGAERTEVSVTGIDLRAQDILAGDLFAALPGTRAHGAEFAAQALDRGAVAVLTDADGFDLVARANPERTVPVLVHPSPRQVLGEVSATVYGHPSEKMQVVGITGTSGKTTTSYLVEAALDAGGRHPALVGTIETRIRGRRVPSALTTPEAPQLHALFAVMVEQGIDTVVMEVSSHALALGRVDGVRFDIGAFTNLSQDHLDFHKDLDDYFAAKARLFDGASSVRADTAVVCIDDVWGERMTKVARDGGEKVVTVATHEDHRADGSTGWTAGPSRPLPSGTQSFDLTGPDGASHHAVVQLPGRYNVANASLAVAAAVVLGVDVENAVRGIAEVDVPGRVQRIERGQSFLAVVDYAHKPAAIEAVISTLRGQAAGRVAIVVGAGGDRDTGKRALMGAAAARGADLVVVTDDNPRSEDPAAIRSAVLAGTRDIPGAERAEVREVGDRAQAIADAVAWAKAGDVVLVAGKGHEIGQEIDGVKHPFDDRDVMSAAIDRLVGGGE